MDLHPKPRIVLADDHGLVRSGLRQLIDGTPDLRVCGEAADGEALLALLKHQAADLVLLDLAMPGLSGVELIRRLRADWPALRILVLSMHNEGQIVSRALKSGATGYATKDCHPDTLLGAIRKLLAGGRFIDPVLVDSVVFNGALDEESRQPPLSPRERQILEMVCAGMPLGDIADRLHLSPKTVSTHKMRLMQKLDLRSNAELLKYALRQGWTSH
jgi:DNA-binding NarL/FixJ family response regulator